MVDRMVYWTEYSPKSSKKKMLEKISSFSTENFIEKTSLKSLKLKNIHVEENDAQVVFEKYKNAEKENSTDKEYFDLGQTVKLELYWSGSRWLVVDDNLF